MKKWFEASAFVFAFAVVLTILVGNFCYADDPLDRESLIKQAESGSLEAMLRLGDWATAEHDNISAYQWFSQASEKGSARSLYELGRMNALGSAFPKDEQAAFRYYQQSAELGYSYALSKLGLAYIEGITVEKDVAKGKELLLKAAQTDDPRAKESLAIAYWFGIGFEVNRKKAIEIAKSELEKCIKNESYLQSDVKRCLDFYECILLIQKEYDLALECMECFLYSPGEPDQCVQEVKINSALTIFACCYARDLSKPRDIKKCHDLLVTAYRKKIDNFSKMYATEQWNWELPIVSYCLAVSQNYPQFVDSKQIFTDVNKLAQQGGLLAPLLVAQFYRDGYGTDKDESQFRYWLDQAAQRGKGISKYNAAIFLEIPKNSLEGFVKSCEYLETTSFNEKGIALGDLLLNNNQYYQMGICNFSGFEILKKTVEIIKNEKDLVPTDKESNTGAKDDLPINGTCSYDGWGKISINISCTLPRNGLNLSKIKVKTQKERTRRHGALELSQYDDEPYILFREDVFYNESDAPLLLARCYQLGFNTPRDTQKELEALKLAVEWGSVEAKNALAMYYWRFDDDELAKIWNQKAMADELPEAYLTQFYMLKYKPDGTENYDEAFPYLLEAVKRNCQEAQVQLAVCRLLGSGINKDVDLALKELKGLVEKKNKTAIGIMSYLYWTGIEVPRDHAKANRLDGIKPRFTEEQINNIGKDFLLNSVAASEKYRLRRMFKKENPVSATLLGFQYEFANSNIPQAIQYYRLAAQKNDPLAQYHLGLLLLNQENEVAQNSTEEPISSSFSLDRGLFYDPKPSTLPFPSTYYGTSQDNSNKKDAASTSVTDSHALSIPSSPIVENALNQGKKPESETSAEKQNSRSSEGIKWLKKSGENGYIDAWYHLACLACEPADPKHPLVTPQEGLEYAKKITNSEFPYNSLLTRLYCDPQYDIYDPRKANEWLDRGVEANEVYCMCKKASILYSNAVTAEEKQKGRELLLKAVELGNAQATFVLQLFDEREKDDRNDETFMLPN